MKLILDTHAFLWLIAGDARLSSTARQAIEDVANEKILSVASIWEIAIKTSRQRLTFREPIEVLIPSQLSINGIQVLEITIDHALLVSKLPLHHFDPFDRLISVQTAHENATLISKDLVFDQYGVSRIW